MDRGARFLETQKVGPGDHSWTSKAAYRVAFVAKAYELAALNIRRLEKKVTGARCSPTIPLPVPKLEAYTGILKETPLFSDIPEWEIRASLLESSLFVPLLWDQMLKEVSSHDNVNKSDNKYLDILPFT
ncbi:hypothetical protein LY76DRAFT_651417 [Colletotrichum caudatum]|nr:hypothetical protein LY76DRAFT_651417 [Colletotrichum caudatum]